MTLRKVFVFRDGDYVMEERDLPDPMYPRVDDRWRQADVDAYHAKVQQLRAEREVLYRCEGCGAKAANTSGLCARCEAETNSDMEFWR